MNFSAHYGKETQEWPPQLDPPQNWDIRIPEPEEEAIERIAQEINAEDLPTEAQIKAIVAFFANHFRYTTYQAAKRLGLNRHTVLSDFLLRTRAGHCEYFASATVLLLRHFNIPARYVVGYAVQEASLTENKTYIIRERHGHAWANAYVNGEWIEVDSTPAGWEAEEEKEFPFYQPLKDQWESFTFGFLEWRWLGERGFLRTAAPWVVLPLTAFLIWRIFGRKMTHRDQGLQPLKLDQGGDSELYLLERKLRRAGLERDLSQTSAQWLNE